jgi:uncharacterized protein
MTPKIEHIFVYPVKSLGGIELAESDLTKFGLANDRRFMLIDENSRFVSQREFPRLALFKTSIDQGVLRIAAPAALGLDPLMVSLNPENKDTLRATVWSDECAVSEVGEEASSFFSIALGMKVRFVYLPDGSTRPVDPRYGAASDNTSLSDGYPILLVGTKSLEELNFRLAEKGEPAIGWDRFRPNVVVRTKDSFEEDSWVEFSIGGVLFKGVKPCSRCIMTTINQSTGEQGKEPLRTLSEFRKFENKVNFGLNVIAGAVSGRIKVGDPVELV